MAPQQHDDENLLNGELARLLTEAGVPAKAERRELGRKMDVVAAVDRTRVVLEAEAGFGKRRQATREADARLKQGLTTLVFAVCYPDGATVDALAGATLTWTLRTRAEGSNEAREGDSPEWREGGVRALADAVHQAPSHVSDADKAAQQLSGALDGAVRRLSPETRRALARTLDLPRTKESRREHDDGYFTAAKRGLLVVATAMLFHHRLRLPADAPPGWNREWPPASPAACATARAVIQTHRESWQAILAVDYRPVFETAIAALDALPVDPDREQMLRELARHIGEIAADTVGLRHDLLGRVFHRVLDTARYDGSFYTSTAAATLLAGLAIRPADADWADPDAIANLRICDPACGTGTLLMAAAERIRALRRATGPLDEDDEILLAEEMVERVLWGYDINLTATHMAASTLGMLSPTTQFRRMNIHRTLLGVYDGQARTGSLEMLDGQLLLADWPSISARVDSYEEAEPPPKMDLVIMNPPFTQQALRHEQFSRSDKQAIKKREKSILDGQPWQAAARLHSSGGMFTVLGTKMLKEGSGTLAMVLPTVALTSPGNLRLRQFLADAFHVDTIVSSHDPQRIFFSENTQIGEILIVLRELQSTTPTMPTRVLNLYKNPSTVLEALNLLESIEQKRKDAPFTIQQVPRDRIEKGNWYAVNFISPYLVENYHSLETSVTNLCHLSEIANIGGQGRSVPTAYTRSNLPTYSGRRALWDHDTQIITTLFQKTRDYIEPKPAQQKMALGYWRDRSRLLVGDLFRLNTARVSAVWVEEPTIGGMWVACTPKSGGRDSEQALAVWFNSSIGLLARLGGRSNRIPSYPRFAIADIEATPVPDFRALGDGPRDALAAAFERLKDEPLASFPQMDEDPVRRAIDEAVTEALGLDPEWVAGIRRELAREPSVTNRRWAG